jgi:Rad3-related DNA helicase
MPNFDFNRYFPFPEIREQQTQAIEFALAEILDQDKRCVVIEAGTGVGKSAIGLTIARYLSDHLNPGDAFKPGAYFLTTQKILQEQYVDDFGTRGMLELKSAANYPCKSKRVGTCDDGQRALHSSTGKDSPSLKSCAYDCRYKTAKQNFIAGELGITNFSYFLAETNYAGKLEPRRVLVLDEAHNAPEQLSSFIEISVSERFCKGDLKLLWPDVKTQPQAIKWVKETYYPKVKSLLEHQKGLLKKYSGLASKLDQFVNVARKLDMLDKHVSKLDRFLDMYHSDNWSFNLVEAFGRSLRKLEFKPIDVAPYSHEYLLRSGHKIVMMSATILDKQGFCKLMGLDEADVGFISIPSPFPVENRPVIAVGIGRMVQSEIDRTLPQLAQAVKHIMDNHPNEKGIVHCHSYKIQNYLRRNIKSSRILYHDSDNRDAILEKHKNSSKPTVLLSPSMTEGVDLKDDLSRFQVICKIPYPYLGDKLIRKKMNKWSWWYPLQTAKTIVQATGRSIRSNDDHAVTYILDSDWDRFYSKHRPMFPEEFREAIKK